jgi:MoaA/NifB/PqqE/SkfB family radical SAM enzyme
MTLSNAYYTATAILGRPRPFVLYHKPTSRCDCKCVFCNSWQHQAQRYDVRPTSDIISLLNNARAGKITTYTLWGGEPLMVKDLPVWLQHAKKIGLRTIMCTSGFNLDVRAKEVAPFIDVLLLSIEATGSRHDKIRRKPGLFEKAFQGLDVFKKHSHGTIIIWCNIGRYNNKYIKDIARLAKEQNIYVEFFPAALFPGYNDDLILNKAEKMQVFSLILDLKKKGFPIHNTEYGLDLMRTARRFKCNTARISIFVVPDGTAFPCDPYLVSKEISYGDIRDLDIKKIPSTSSYRKAIEKLAHCNKCLLPCVSHAADNLFRQTVRRIVQ